MSKVIRIGVQNFQVFREFTEIPLADLTLFFGPNSAGKSAVFDALEVLRQVMSPPEWSGRGGPFDDIDPELRQAILERHWRREEGDVFADGPMRLLAEFEVPPVARPLEGDPLSQDKRVGKHRRDTRVQWKDRVVLLDVSFPASTWSTPANAEERGSGPTWKVFVGGSLVYMYEDQGFVFVALDHPYIHELFPEVAEYEDAWRLAETSYLQLTNGGAAVVADVAYSGGFRLMLPESVLEESDDYQTEQLHRFEEFHDSLTAHLQRLCTRGLEFSRVEASRGVPTPKDLTYVVEEISPRHPLGGVIECDAGDPRYRWMALDFASLVIEGRTTLESGSAVNRWLRDHLFLDKGYQLAVDVDRVAHGAHLGASQPLNGLAPGKSATHLARLVLVDSNGRRYLFHEVGSGLGYLLPVLAGAAQGGVQCVEQPELHLHPAMQAALGDVLIEAANSGAQLLVETHSEHLILRLLRRIRQTHAGKPLDENLRVRPESVSVIYFLPGEDGITRARQLRVTDEGDFMDRWPNGFFEERGGEIWDE